jgi:hypothetical protein
MLPPRPSAIASKTGRYATASCSRRVMGVTRGVASGGRTFGLATGPGTSGNSSAGAAGVTSKAFKIEERAA